MQQYHVIIILLESIICNHHLGLKSTEKALLHAET